MIIRESKEIEKQMLERAGEAVNPHQNIQAKPKRSNSVNVPKNSIKLKLLNERNKAITNDRRRNDRIQLQGA